MCATESPHVRESKTVLNWILDSTLWIPDSRYWIRAEEVGFQILIVSRIPDSLSCIPVSTSQNFPDSGIRIPLHGAN